MGWKNWPSWVNGVIIALVLYLISLISGYYGMMYSLLLGYPVSIILTRVFNYWELGYIHEGGFPYIMSIIIIPFIMSIVYGALIGYIIGKLKSKNQNINNKRIIKRI